MFAVFDFLSRRRRVIIAFPSTLTRFNTSLAESLVTAAFFNACRHTVEPPVAHRHHAIESAPEQSSAMR